MVIVRKIIEEALNKMKIKCVVIFLILAYMICIFPEVDFAQLDATAVEEGNISNISNMKPEISAPFIELTQTATITYPNINIDFDIDDCTYENSGIDVVSMTKIDDGLMFQVQPTINEGFGELKININSESTILQDTVYIYNTGEKMFFDKISKYQAWYSAMLYLYEQNTEDNIIISEEEICNQYSTFTAPLIEGTPIIQSNNSDCVIFTGNIVWETADSPKGYEPTLELRNALIEIGTKDWRGFNEIASTYTDDLGNYEIKVDSNNWSANEKIYLRVNLKAKTYEVSTFWFFPHYFYEYDLNQNISNGSTVAYDIRIKCDNDEDIYRATYVHQAMTIAERFAEAMGFESDNFIRVVYPAESGYYKVPGIDYPISLSDMAFCYGDFDNNCIAAIGIDSYNNTKTIVHEYSHYIQCSLGNFGEGLPQVLFLSTHVETNDNYEQKGDKSFAMHLSYAEGWGYAFSVMAQLYYLGQYSSMLNQENTIETSINSTDDHNNYLGEFQEKSVKTFLWSLIDKNAVNCNIDTSNATLDYQLPWTPQEWWKMTTIQGTCRLPDFINLIENESYNLGVDIDYKQIKEYIADKLTTYNIAPEITSISFTDGDVTAPPVLRFIPNGSVSYPNNLIVIKIYDSNYQLLAESEEIYFNAFRVEMVNGARVSRTISKTNSKSHHNSEVFIPINLL